MLEDLNENKSNQQEIMSNTGIYTEKLNESLEMLKNNTTQVNLIQNNIVNERIILNDIKVGSLNAKEHEIKSWYTSFLTNLQNFSDYFHRNIL